MATSGTVDLGPNFGGGGGSGVSTINGITGAAVLVAGSGISITPSGQNITIAATGGGGTVTSVSVVSANGLAGTVATATTTPSITLSTTITGILQGNGTAISAATTGNLTDAGTDGIVITGGTGSVLGAGTSITQHVSDATHNGYLSSTDWNTFNNKQSTLNLGNLTDAGTDGITVTGGTGAVVGTGTSLSQHVADATHNGYLSSTDWTTFNGKQAAGNYITALTGDGTATGPGSVALTLATVNGNVGSFGSSTSIPTFTVNAKGLVTAASGNVVIAPAGTLTGTTLNSTVVSSSLTSVGTISTGVWNGTLIGPTFGGTGLSSYATGDTIYASASNVLSKLTIGSSGQILTVAGGVPSWATLNAITALTGDVTATGPGSVASTIAVGAVTDTKGSLANKPASTVVATTNQTLSGTPTIDGQATASGSIILLSAQTSGSENGPWVASAGAWSRPTWYPSGGTTQAFQFITTLIRLGTTYQGSVWRMTTAGAITIDTTATTWVVTPKSLNTNTVVPGANNTQLTTNGSGVVAWTANPSPYSVSSINSNTTGVNGTTYLCDTSGGAFNLTLFSPVSGAFVIIKDKTGSFQTNNLTVVRFGSEKIEGIAASKALQTNWGAFSLFSDGTDWFMGPF